MPTTATATPVYYTVSQVAQLLQVSCECVRQWARRGWCPEPLKPGARAWRFRRDEIDQWIERGCPRLESAGV